MPLAFADVTGGARYPPALSREGKLELTKASRSPDRGCGNSRRFPPGEARADRSERSGSETRRHPCPQFQKVSAQTAVEGVPREATERGALGHLSPAPGGPGAKREGIPLPTFPREKAPRLWGDRRAAFVKRQGVGGGSRTLAVSSRPYVDGKVVSGIDQGDV
jgi:hypothetical protein